MKLRNYAYVLLMFVLFSCGSGTDTAEKEQKTKQDSSKATTAEKTDKKRERVIKMDGNKNFRDLGGYTNAQGAEITWGKLYRSEKLSELSDSDVEKMKELGIKTVIDLRTDRERERDPSKHPEGVNVVTIPIWREAWNDYLKLRDKELDSLEKVAIKEKLESTMEETYTAFPEEFKDEAAKFISLLADEENYPVLFHCTAGTDRTGFMAALTLSLLDVPKETIIDDYAMSQELRYEDRKEKDTRIKGTIAVLHEKYDGAEGYLQDIDPENASAHHQSLKEILLEQN